MLRTRPSRAKLSSDEYAADAHSLARALFARSGEPGPEGLPNQAPTVTIDLSGAALDPETLVNTFTIDNQAAPAIASLTGGGYVVVWQSAGQDFGGEGIYAQRYSAGGDRQGGEMPVNTVTANSQSAPAIAGLAGGGYVIVWTSSAQDGSGGGVFAQRYNSNGVSQGGETQVNTFTTGAQGSPAIAALAGGGYLAVWISDGQDGSGYGIYAQRYDASGVLQGPETRVNTFISDNQVFPAVTGLAGGGYVIVWQSIGQDGDGYGVYAQRYDSNGVTQGPETRVNTFTTNNQAAPAVTGLAGGGYVIAWESNGQDGSVLGIYAQRYDAGGVAQGPEVRVNTFITNNQSNPAIAAIAGGGYVITWQSDQGSSGAGIYAQRYDSGGMARGLETQVNTSTAGNPIAPVVAGLAGGDYVVAWNSPGSQPGSVTDVYAQRFGDAQATEQVALSLRHRIFIDDADAGGVMIHVTLSVAQGVLTVTAGGSGAAVSGSGTGTVTLNGTLSHVRALLTTDASSTISFTPDSDNPPATIALTVTINDNGSTGEGGPLSAVAIANIGIIPVSDAPESNSATRNIVLGNNYTFGLGDFPFDDPEGDALLAVKISSLPNQGVLLLNGTPITAGIQITASDIAAGLLTYMPDPGEQGFAYASFGWQARDTGGVSDNQSTDQTPAFITFNISQHPVYLYGAAILAGTFPTIQAALDAASGFQNMVVATGTYSGAVTFDVSGLSVRFDPGGVQNMTWTPVGTIGIEINAGEGNDVIATGGGVDTIRGAGGNDYLDGGLGADELEGGTGDDTYVVDNGGDIVRELLGGGADIIKTSVSYALALGVEVETLSTRVHAGTEALNLTGNEFGQTIVGNAGANIINGRGGADVMAGLAGDDTYVVDTLLDQVLENAGGGNDVVLTNLSYILSSNQSIETLSTQTHAGTEHLFLTGNQLDNILIGNAGNNLMNGNAGADVMRGLAGDDTYVVDNALDLVIELANQGNDTVRTHISHTLSNGNEIETLSTVTHAGTTAINLGGSDYDNTIIGNYGANHINGRGGVDRMIGLRGDDTYVVDNALDTVEEAADGGTDTLLTHVGYTLAARAQVETLSTATHGGTAAIDLTGNEFAQTIIGNAGANLIDGKSGSDTLRGFGGADIFAFTTALGAGNVDTIVDFNVADDTIRLDDAIFAALGAPGTLSANAFVTGTGAADASDRIIYNSATGALLYDADGTGGTAAVQFATLAAGLALTAGDFVVI